MRFRTTLALSAFLAVSASAPLVAQTVITPAQTTSGNPLTNPNSWNLNDGNTCPGAGTACPGADPAAITSTNLGPAGSGGTGSLQFTITGAGQSPSATYIFGSTVAFSDLFTSTGALTAEGQAFTLDYDYLSTGVPGGGSPTIRLLVTGLNSVNGRTDGSLGWYDSSPTGSWETADNSLTDGDFFLRVGGAHGQAADACTSASGSFDDRRQTISTWEQTCTGANGTYNLDDAEIYGVQVDWGSFSTTTTQTSFADLVNFNVGGNNADADFETTEPSSTTPEPGTMALMATGLVGMGGVGFKRRRNKKQSS